MINKLFRMGFGEHGGRTFHGAGVPTEHNIQKCFLKLFSEKENIFKHFFASR